MHAGQVRKHAQLMICRASDREGQPHLDDAACSDPTAFSVGSCEANVPLRDSLHEVKHCEGVASENSDPFGPKR